MAKKKKKEKSFIVKTLWRFWGALLILLPLYALLSCAFYHIDDNSFLLASLHRSKTFSAAAEQIRRLLSSTISALRFFRFYAPPSSGDLA